MHESTGSYHVELVDFLIERNYAVAVVLPSRVRDFARGMGWLAKTDAIDARLEMAVKKGTSVAAKKGARSGGG